MIRPILAACVLAVVLASPAAAHKLKVFASVEGDAVVGYAFFIGGGRAMNTPWTARSAGGAEFASGLTDGEGRFRVVPPRPVVSDTVITVDTREGHIASAVVPAARLGGQVPASPPADAGATPSAAAAQAPSAPDAASAAMVEAAVQRQVEPLLERIEEMDNRLRMTDIVSGMFLIFGLAGMVLWVRGRAR